MTNGLISILIFCVFTSHMQTANSIYIKPLNNTVGIYYHKEGELKISNDNWKLLVYKDIPMLETAFENDKMILTHLNDMLYPLSPNLLLRDLSSDLRTHVSLLERLSDSLQTKFSEVKIDVNAYRRKRGILNGMGSILKAITGNLDSSDGEYYEQCINKLEHDEHEMQNLLKNQILVTTFVIKKFNNTMRKLQMDEETFNKNIKLIENAIFNISENQNYYESKLKVLNICEQLTESFILIEEQLNDILNSITFARLRIIHPSIIQPYDFINQLVNDNFSIITEK